MNRLPKRSRSNLFRAASLRGAGFFQAQGWQTTSPSPTSLGVMMLEVRCQNIRQAKAIWGNLLSGAAHSLRRIMANNIYPNNFHKGMPARIHTRSESLESRFRRSASHSRIRGRELLLIIISGNSRAQKNFGTERHWNNWGIVRRRETHSLGAENRNDFAKGHAESQMITDSKVARSLGSNEGESDTWAYIWIQAWE